MGQKKTDMFTWSCNASKPVFPIDYSQRQLASQLGKNARSLERLNIFKNTILKTQFQNQLSEKSSHTKQVYSAERKKNAVTSFPLESIPFFESFFRTTDQKKIYEYISPSNIPDGFVFDFCNDLRNEVSTDSIPGNRYCRHQLFNNPTFQSAAVSDLWRETADKRYQQLLNAISTKDPQARISTLINLILFLDSLALQLHYEKEAEKESPGLQTLNDLLSSLMQRKRKPSELSYAQYLITDILFKDSNNHDTKLSDAFQKLDINSSLDSGQLMQLTREIYLKNLDQQSTPSDFEKNYTAVQEYLVYTGVSTAQQQLEDFVQARFKQYCISNIFEPCFLTFDHIVYPSEKDISSLKYVAQLTDYLIQLALTPDCAHYQATIQLLTCLHMASYVSQQQKEHIQVLGKHNPIFAQGYTLITQTVTEIENKDENYTYQETLRFSELFSSAWKYLYGEDIFDSTTKLPLSPSNTAQKIHQDGHKASEYFNRNFPYFPTSIEKVQKMLDSYTEIMRNPHKYHPYDKLLSFVPPLLTFTLLAVFHHIAEHKIPLIVKDIQRLSAY